MKARLRFVNGKWWCRRMGATGCGDTMEEAWNDMWSLYRGFIRQSIQRSHNAQASGINVRA